MKKINYNFTILIFLVLTIIMSSCQKALDVNKTPNNLTTAVPQLVLPAAQSALATTFGDQWNGGVGAIWAQYWTGGYGVSTGQLEFYNMTSAASNAGWRDMYAGSLKDFNYLIQSGEPRYAGVAKITSAFIYQYLVDLFGDIPFDEALKGDQGIISPKYNTELEVYSKLIPLINEGLKDIDSVSPSPSIVFKEIENEDFLYGGDLQKWKNFANTLKLKILLRSGKYTEAYNLLNSGVSFISSSGDEAKFNYYETSKNVNPIYNNYVNTSSGNFYVATKSSIDVLTELSDPRIRTIYTVGSAGDSGVYSGDINVNTAAYPPLGVNTRFSRPNIGYVYSPVVPVFFISSWESKFLQAEALIRHGDDASLLLQEAITENFSYYDLTGTQAANYFTALGYNPSSPLNTQLDILAVQKWISMNGLQMIEGWIESVRLNKTNVFTNIFTSPTNSTLGNGNYPTSFVYPSSEINSNPNVPTNRLVTNKRFWAN
jgi:hypothetical protein